LGVLDVMCNVNLINMKSFLKLFLFFSVLITGHRLVAQNTFQRSIHGTEFGSCYNLVLTSDGNYAFTGGTGDLSNGSSKVLLCKIDTYGNIIWSKTYGGNVNVMGSDLEQTNDGGYIIDGIKLDTVSPYFKSYIVKTNNSGDTLWTKFYGKTNAGISTGSIIQTADGGYVILGSSILNGTGLQSILLIKLNSTGNILWNKTYTSSFSCWGIRVLQANDGGFVISGGIAITQYEELLLKTDSLGNIVFIKTYGNSNQSEGPSYFIKTIDGDYIIAGTIYKQGAYDLLLVKTNSLGDTLWTKSLQDSDYLYSSVQSVYIQQVSNGGYIIAGEGGGGVVGMSGDSASVFLIKTDISGNPLWSRKFGTIHQWYGESADCVKQTPDGGYIIGGHTNDAGAFTLGAMDTYIIKTDSNGYSNCFNLASNFIPVSNNIIVGSTSFTISTGINAYHFPSTASTPNLLDSLLCFTTDIPEINILNQNLKCYPNPFSDFTIIDFNNDKNQKFTLNIYDFTGRIIREIKNITSNEIRIERNNSKDGLYFFQLRNDSKIIGTGKFIIEK